MKILYEGKSKVVCEGVDADSFILKYKDTATAFNGEKKENLKDKGALNAEISNMIFAHLAENGIETHLIRVLDQTTVLVKKAEIILVEVIIRNIAAGSFSKKYGVAEGTSLRNTVVEFSYKSDALGDPMINESQITALGIASKSELEFMAAQAVKINQIMCEMFQKVGITLVDFKVEFGRIGDRIILCDEISPDSCRFWDASTNEKLDKDRFRRDLGDVTAAYKTVLERLKNA